MMYLFESYQSFSFPQMLGYVFHLYLGKKVESVNILAEQPECYSSITFPLDCCPDDEKYWKSRQLLLPVNRENTFRYLYVVKYRQGFGTRILQALPFKDKDKTTVKELHYRKLQRGMHQYDIFKDPNETYDNNMKNIVLGHMFFVDRLYQMLGNGYNPTELLIECEHIGFGTLGVAQAELELFIPWAEEVINKSPDSYQSVYIGSLLGQLVHHTSTSSQRICYKLGKKAADKLLSSFGLCSCKELPQSSKGFLKLVAEDLFKVGSSKGWLLFINFFCKLLDTNYVMQVADKFSSQSYNEEQFDQQVANVLDSLSTLEDLDSRRKFSCYIMGHSPSVHCLWNLYQVMSCRLPNLLQAIMAEFESIYCKFISRPHLRRVDLLQPSFWRQVPDNLKEILADPFCKMLTEQILSETTWSKERLSRLKTIALDARLQVSDQFSHFIFKVATHKCKEVVSILEDFLDSETFSTFWKTRMSNKDKETICLNWLRVHFHHAGKKPKENILGVVKACESLCATNALKKDKTLCLDIEKEVEGLVLRQNFQSIMDAFEDAQNCSPVIQQRLTMLLKSAIKHQSGTGDRRSRYKQMIHFLGYDSSNERRKELPKVKLDG